MIKNTADKLSNYLIQNGAPIEKKNIYSYGAECLMNEMISDFFLLIIGIITNQILALFCWALFFTLLRVKLGGYHAPSHFLCITASTIIGTLSLFVNPLWTKYPIAIYITCIISLIITILITPVFNANHPLSENAKKIARIQAITICSIEILLILILKWLDILIYPFILTGMLFAIILGVLGILYNLHSKSK